MQTAVFMSLRDIGKSVNIKRDPSTLELRVNGLTSVRRAVVNIAQPGLEPMIPCLPDKRLLLIIEPRVHAFNPTLNYARTIFSSICCGQHAGTWVIL